MADNLIIHIDGDDSGYKKALKNIEKNAQKTVDNISGDVKSTSDKTKKSSNNTQKSVKKDFKATEKQSKTTGKNIGENFEDGFDKVEKAAEKTKSSIGKIFAGVGTAIAGGLGLGTFSLASISEDTREYREDLNRLDAAFLTADKSISSARQSYSEFYQILGESDRSVEAVNHLAQLCNNQEELAYWSDICAGVSATFGDSLPIEGLTEAANETAKVGKVTGPLADALNWVGILEDDFNEKLAKCNSEQERSTLITKTLSKAYEKQANTYKDLNSDVMESRKANQEFSDTLAEIGEAGEPVVTGLKEIGSEILKSLLPVVGQLADYIQRNMPKIKEAVMGLFDNVKDFIMFVIDNKESVIMAISAIGAAFLTWKGVKAVSDTTQSLKNMSSALLKILPSIGVATTTTGGFLSTLASAVPTVLGVIAAFGGLVSAGKILIDYLFNGEPTEEYTALEGVKERVEDIGMAYSENISAIKENAEAEAENIAVLSTLKNELDKIVDANGNVQAGYETRAQYIMGELSEATGVEGELIDGKITDWQNYSAAVDSAVTALQKEIMIEAESNKIRAAYESITDLRDEEAVRLEAYTSAQLKYNEAQEEYLKQIEETGNADEDVIRKVEDMRINLDSAAEAYGQISSKIEGFGEDIRESEEIIADLSTATPEQVEEMFTESTGVVVSEGAKLTNSVKTVGTNYGAEFIAALKSAQNNMGNVIGEGNQEALDKWDAFLDGLEEKGVQIPEILRIGIEDGKVQLNGSIQEIAAAMRLFFQNLPEEVGTAEAMAAVTEDFEKDSKGLAESGADGFDAGAPFFKTAANNSLDGILATFNSPSAKSRIWVANYNLAKEGVAGYNAGQDAASPAKEYIKASKNSVDGLIKGIKDNKDGFLDEIGALVDDGKSEVEKAMEDINKTTAKLEFERRLEFAKSGDEIWKIKQENFDGLLESEKEYLAETRRIELENDEKEHQERLANAKDAEEREKIKQERIKKEAEKGQKAYLAVLEENAEKEKKLLEAQQKDLENAKKKAVETLQDMAEEAFDAIEELEDMKNSIADKYKDYGKLYYTYTLPSITINGVEETPEITKLADLSMQTAEMEKYADNLELLTKRADIPKELLNKIRELSPEDAMKYVDTLVKADDEEFEKHINGYLKLGEDSERISEILTADDMLQFTATLEEKFGEIPEGFFDIGGLSAENFTDGFMEEFNKMWKRVKEMIIESAANLTPNLNMTVALAGGGGGNVSNSYSSTYYVQAVEGETTESQLRAIHRAETLNNMRGGY